MNCQFLLTYIISLLIKFESKSFNPVELILLYIHNIFIIHFFFYKLFIQIVHSECYQLFQGIFQMVLLILVKKLNISHFLNLDILQLFHNILF
jgi:hypothetical protein